MAMVIKALGLLSDRLHSGASVRNVFGDPVEAHGRTVIPVARIGYGFGAGGRAGGNEAAGSEAARPRWRRRRRPARAPGRGPGNYRGRNALHPVHRPGPARPIAVGRVPDRPQDWPRIANRCRETIKVSRPFRRSAAEYVVRRSYPVFAGSSNFGVGRNETNCARRNDCTWSARAPPASTRRHVRKWRLSRRLRRPAWGCRRAQGALPGAVPPAHGHLRQRGLPRGMRRAARRCGRAQAILSKPWAAKFARYGRNSPASPKPASSIFC